MDVLTAPADPRTDLAPKLSAYAAIHDAMERDAGRLALAAATFSTRARAALPTWWDRFERDIEHHHEREDDLVFPLVAELDPGFTSDELVADHTVLDLHLAQCGAAVARLGDGGRTADAVELARAARDLQLHLADHLRREEAVVFPVLDAGVTAEAYARVEAEMRRGMPLSSMAFTVPWILDELDPVLAGHVLDDAPAVLRFLDRVWFERSYRKVAGPVWEAICASEGIAPS
jgi:Hemerythrin HHE cation binding domain